ncbi:EamA family transporter [Legionella sp.]|uniref:EamA family transporter n=1 Tax=Legionella sp. TaxID=459 RepID=UPI00321FC9DA
MLRYLIIQLRDLGLKILSLPLSSLLLALLVPTVWGVGYIMIKTGLNQIPPITLCALRFILVSFPAILFVPKPKIKWRYILGYGLLTFALPFTFLFIGIAAGVAPGSASLIFQLKVFFAIFFAWFLLCKSVSIWQLAGAYTSMIGIVILFSHHDQQFSLTGFCFILLACLCWGLGNLISVKLKNINMFALIVWCSFVACVPLSMLAFILESPLSLFMPLGELKGEALLAVLYLSYASTYLGYSGWSWLLSKHSVALISPFAFLCPIVAIATSALFLAEPLTLWKILAGVIVIIGLSLNAFGQRIYHRVIKSSEMRKTSPPTNTSTKI